MSEEEANKMSEEAGNSESVTFTWTEETDEEYGYIVKARYEEQDYVLNLTGKDGLIINVPEDDIESLVETAEEWDDDVARSSMLFGWDDIEVMEEMFSILKSLKDGRDPNEAVMGEELKEEERVETECKRCNKEITLPHDSPDGVVCWECYDEIIEEEEKEDE